MGILSYSTSPGTVSVQVESMLDELNDDVRDSLSGNSCAAYTKFDLIYTLLQENYYDSEELDIEDMRENALK